MVKNEQVRVLTQNQNFLSNIIKDSGQNRHYTELLLGYWVDWGKWGIKWKLLMSPTWWRDQGRVKTWNASRLRRFKTQKMPKNRNIYPFQFLCQKTAIRVEKHGKDNWRRTFCQKCSIRWVIMWPTQRRHRKSTWVHWFSGCRHIREFAWITEVTCR